MPGVGGPGPQCRHGWQGRSNVRLCAPAACTLRPARSHQHRTGSSASAAHSTCPSPRIYVPWRT
eukprot:1395000-Lingulodinium_polyedra.AAC.1